MNPPKAAPSAWYLAKVPSALGGWSSLQRGPAGDAAGEKGRVSPLLRKHRPRDGSLSQLWESLCNRPQAQGREGASSGLSEHCPRGAAGPHNHRVPSPLHRGDAGSNLLTLRSRCRRIGLVLGNRLSSSLSSARETRPGVQLCLCGRGSGHSAGDTGKGWAPAVSPSGCLL